MVKAVKKKAKKPVKKPLDKKTISKELTKQKLLDAAMEVFAKNGFDGATTKEISEHAGVNEALITRYFKGKQGLYDSLVIRYYATKNRVVQEFTSGENLYDDLKRLLNAIVADYAQSTQFLQVLLPRVILDKSLKQQIRKQLNLPSPQLKAFVQHYQKKKIIRSDLNFQAFQDILIYFCGGMINDKVLLDLGTLPMDEVTEHAAMMLEAYLTKKSK